MWSDAYSWNDQVKMASLYIRKMVKSGESLWEEVKGFEFKEEGVSFFTRRNRFVGTVGREKFLSAVSGIKL